MMESSLRTVVANLGYKYLLEIEELQGGSIHHVYRIRDKVRGVAVVKVRMSKPKIYSGFGVESSEIEHEALALTQFAGYPSGVLPQLLAVNPEEGVLVMTPIVEGGVDLKTWVSKQGLPGTPVLLAMARSIEETLRTAVEPKTPAATALMNDERFSALVRERFKYQDQSLVQDLLESLIADEEHRGFIMGGLSFKNILFDGSTYGFCDFETFCFGHPIFDLGYFFGHTLLHTIDEDRGTSELIDSLRTFLNDKSVLLVSQHEGPLVLIILLTMLYRLNHPDIVYSLKNPPRLSGRQPLILKLASNGMRVRIEHLRALID